MAIDRGQEFDDLLIAPVGKKGVIPSIDQMRLGQRLDFREVHYHPIIGLAGSRDDLPGKRDFDGVPMAVQMSALAAVVGDAMAGIEFEAARDLHGLVLS